jgi:hypothetical protein
MRTAADGFPTSAALGCGLGAVLGRALGTTSEDFEAGIALQHIDIDPYLGLGRLGSTKNWSFSESILV